ncbi:hypothetical protein, partial [Thiolapillus sp.]
KAAQGNLEKLLPWNFSRRKPKMRFSFCSHFQSLEVIENGGTSLSRKGISIFRDALNSLSSN